MLTAYHYYKYKRIGINLKSSATKNTGGIIIIILYAGESTIPRAKPLIPVEQIPFSQLNPNRLRVVVISVVVGDDYRERTFY